MATQDPTTTKHFDSLAELADAYEALSSLVSEHEPAWVLLENLNRQLRAFLDHADTKGLLT
jgi:hypothetical protein